MSRIDDLIARHSPNGVIYRSLSEVAQTVTGLSGKTKVDFLSGNARFVTYKNAYAHLVVDQEAPDFVTMKSGEKQNRLHVGDIVFTGSSESIGEVGLSSVVASEPANPLYLNSFCFALRFNNQDLFLPGFSKHLFRSESLREQIRATANGVTRINISKARFMKIRIPVPPIAVQWEIVRILDKFVQMEAEMEAELEARKCQSSFYRDSLLTFTQVQTSQQSENGPSPIGMPNNVEFRRLDEIFTIKGGYTPSKIDESLWADGTVPWFRMEDIRKNGRVLNDSIQHITSAAVKGGRLFPPNSLMISTSATIGEHALVMVPHLSNQRFTSLSLKNEWIDRVDMKFMFYCGFLISDWCKQNTNMSSFASVDMKGFRSLQIPVPDLSEQKRIVNILDTFSDIEAELEEELKARRTQYSYYRDRLLVFGEDKATVK